MTTARVMFAAEAGRGDCQWVAFGVLYAAHTTLNVLAHREAPVS